MLQKKENMENQCQTPREKKHNNTAITHSYSWIMGTLSQEDVALEKVDVATEARPLLRQQHSATNLSLHWLQTNVHHSTRIHAGQERKAEHSEQDRTPLSLPFLNHH